VDKNISMKAFLRTCHFFCSEVSTGFLLFLDARSATPAAVARRAELVLDPYESEVGRFGPENLVAFEQIIRT